MHISSKQYLTYKVILIRLGNWLNEHYRLRNDGVIVCEDIDGMLRTPEAQRQIQAIRSMVK